MNIGPAIPKHTQLAAAQIRRDLLLRVLLYADKLRFLEPDISIGPAFFERVGKAMTPAIGRSLAEELYYEAKRLL